MQLTDFGFAKADITDDNGTRTFCGTVQYMSPEIVQKTGHGKSADWWALGVLTYEMLTGKTPFHAKNRKAIQQKIMSAKVQFPRWMSPEVQSFIRGLLRRPINKRFDWEEVQAHRFFDNLDWDKLLRRQIVPPYKPPSRGQQDVSCFDPRFTNEPVVDSPCLGPLSPSVEPMQHHFMGFSYCGSAISPPNHALSTRGSPGARKLPGGTALDVLEEGN